MVNPEIDWSSATALIMLDAMEVVVAVVAGVAVIPRIPVFQVVVTFMFEVIFCFCSLLLLLKLKTMLVVADVAWFCLPENCARAVDVFRILLY